MGVVVSSRVRENANERKLVCYPVFEQVRRPILFFSYFCIATVFYPQTLRMVFSWAGFIINLLLFALGVYVYLFSRGFIRFGSEEVRARSEQFRKENAGWMRILGLALAAIMLVSLVLDVQAMME